MRAPARPAALVFDLDGTLVDSRRDIATAVGRLRGEAGLPPLTLDEVVAMVGDGARLLVRRALGPDFPDSAIDGPGGALARYLEIYREVCLDTTLPYPGIAELLPELGRRYPLALLSNKGKRSPACCSTGSASRPISARSWAATACRAASPTPRASPSSPAASASRPATSP